MIAGLAMAGLKQFDAAVKELTQAREAFARNKNSTFAALVDSYMAELALKRGNADEALSRAGLALRTFARQKLLIKAARARSSGSLIVLLRNSVASVRAGIENLTPHDFSRTCVAAGGELEQIRFRLRELLSDTEGREYLPQDIVRQGFACHFTKRLKRAVQFQ